MESKRKVENKFDFIEDTLLLHPSPGVFFELSNDVQTIIIITPRHNQKKKTENKFEKNENNILSALRQCNSY